jgi:hypothetical protein
MIGEDQHNANNQKLIAYNDFLRQLAKERNLPLADLAAQMQAEIASETAAGWTPGHLLTVDGVHMNPRGNVVMATGILKAVGFTDEQIAKAHEIWLDIPDGWSAKLTIPVTVTKSLTLRQYDALQKTAPKNSAGGVYELLQQLYHDDFLAVLSPGDKDGLEKLKKQLQEKIDQDIDQRLKQ